MKDVAMTPDKRGVSIQRVGVKELHLPLLIKQKDGGFQSVLANITVGVELPKDYRGTHMSRLVEIVFKWSQKPLSGHDIKLILEQVRERLNATRANITVRFKYFMEKQAPVSGSVSALDYDCEFTGTLSDSNLDFILGVEVPITALCPCSKEISDYGAHNQRGVIRARIRYQGNAYYWIEDLVTELESTASCGIYPLLKRSDEKFVTERAYQTPKFVEDILRDAVLVLRGSNDILWYELETETFESIHNHSAYAYQCEWRKDWEAEE
ncbi:MAG: GTP cyclohydrolase FolE2 [Armatimonadota bacterium]|nr:GTP cyclohydrolase FolE2 [bacterium]